MPRGRRRILRQIERKTIGVVKRERRHAVEQVALLERLAGLVEDRKPAVERAAKADFLELQRLGDQGFGAIKFWIRLAHLAISTGTSRHISGSLAPRVGMAHGAAHDAAKHIAAAFVRRQHAVGDQKRAGAQMIGDDPMRDFALAVRVDAGEIGEASISARNRSIS